MIAGDGTAVVDAGPDEVLAFLLDLDRYRQADHKIGRVHAIERSGDRGRVRFSGRLGPLPSPAAWYRFMVGPGPKVTFDSEPRGAGRFLFEFHGTFEWRALERGTEVHHREEVPSSRRWVW